MLRYTLLIASLCLSLVLCAQSSGSRLMEPTDLRRVTNTPEERLNLNPSLSGDGQHLAFESNADLANTGGASGFRAFHAGLNTQFPSFDQLGITRAVSPAVSQDGSSIAFASKDNPLGTNVDGNSEIFLYASVTLTNYWQSLPIIALTQFFLKTVLPIESLQV